MKQCPTCKRTYDDATAFCKECGIALVQTADFSQANQNIGYAQPAPATNAVPMNEHKEWCFKADWGGTGYKITNVIANGPTMEIEQYKQYILKFGKQKATVDAREITDVHVQKKIQFNSILLIICGLMLLALSDSTLIGIATTLVGIIFLKNKYYVVTHRRGSVNIPSAALDSGTGQEFLDYITKYSPYAVKTDLSLGR